MVKARSGMIEGLVELLERMDAREDADIGHYKAFPIAPPAGSPYIQCHGQQNLLKSEYPKLYAYLGNTFGGAQAGTTFGLPDARGCVIAGADNMGGTAANRLTGRPGGVNGAVVGSFGGSEQQALTIAQMPEHDHGGSVGQGGVHTHTVTANNRYGADTSGGIGGWDVGDRTHGTNIPKTTNDAPAHSHAISKQGNGAAHNNVQPTIIGIICIYAGQRI